jgi:hypothetical protein
MARSLRLAGLQHSHGVGLATREGVASCEQSLSEGTFRPTHDDYHLSATTNAAPTS